MVSYKHRARRHPLSKGRNTQNIFFPNGSAKGDIVLNLQSFGWGGSQLVCLRSPEFSGWVKNSTTAPPKCKNSIFHFFYQKKRECSNLVAGKWIRPWYKIIPVEESWLMFQVHSRSLSTGRGIDFRTVRDWSWKYLKTHESLSVPVSQRTMAESGNVNYKGLDQNVLGGDGHYLPACTGLLFNSDTLWQSLELQSRPAVSWVCSLHLPFLGVGRDQVLL